MSKKEIVMKCMADGKYRTVRMIAHETFLEEFDVLKVLHRYSKLFILYAAPLSNDYDCSCVYRINSRYLMK